MRKIEKLYALSFLVLAASCNSETKKEEPKNPTEFIATEDSIEDNVETGDTLRATRETVNPGNNTLTATGSGLSAEQSNLNVDAQLAADQLFDFNKSTLKPEAEEMLTQLAANLESMGDESVRITGHTDSKGDNSYNKKLSLDRANAVKDWLVKKGLKNQILTEGKGEEEPIAENTTSDGKDNEEGRAKNRRVEVKYLGTQSISK